MTPVADSRFAHALRFFSTISFTALTLAAGHVQASYQVISNVDLDANGRRALVVRSATATPELRAGRFAGGTFTFTNLNDPGVNVRLLGTARLNAGAKSELLFQNIIQGEFGEASAWLDFDSSQPRLLRNVKRVWNVQAVGDLDGDGFGDLVWRYVVSDSPDTGVSYIWFTQGAPFTDATIADPRNVVQVRKRGGAPLSWRLLGAQDINGDGAADMLYISPTGDIRILMATPNRTCANINGGTVPAAFRALRFANFSGNGRGDVLYRNVVTGAVQIASLDARALTLPPYTGAADDQNASCTGSTLSAVSTPITNFPATDPSWELYGIADLDGNGIIDIIWVRPNGQLTVWLGNGPGVAVTEIANAGTAPFFPAGSLTGQLVDAPVTGVRYSTSSGVSGITDVNGSYRYNAGDVITFSLGGLTIGAVTATPRISPLELAGGNATKLTNILVLLQSLDADATPANGINITAPTAAAVTSAINLAQDPLVFASTANTALRSAMTAGGLTGSIRTITQANAHFSSQAMSILTSNIWHITNGVNDTTFVRFLPGGEYLIGQAAADHYVEYGTATVQGFDAQTFDIQFKPSVNRGVGATIAPVITRRFRSDGDALINPQNERMPKVENVAGSLVGVWAGSTTTAGKTVTIMFTSNGKFMMIDPIGDVPTPGGTSCGGPGVEYGSYVYNATTRLLSVSNVVFDTNGCAGLRDATTGTVISGLIITLNADGITATVTAPGEQPTLIYRVSR